jgi:hypothetical protein
MTITLTKSGPFYASGAISFSSLRTNFKATDIDGTVSADTSPISASQLKRITSQSDDDPTVPDATENTQISTGNNLSISQFRNSVKYYKVSQTDTNTNLNISTQAWNTNLSKNIKKKVSIVGTIGSSDTNIPALLTTYGQHCNLEIAVTGTGKVIGAGGTAGTANGGSGGNGGTAMDLLNSLAASVIKITVVSGANIYGGGGGGGAGTKGGTGGQGGNGLADGGTTSVYQELTGATPGTRCSNQSYNAGFGNIKGENYYFSTICSQAGYSGYYYTSVNVPQNCGPGHTNFQGTCFRTVTTQNADIATTGGNGGEGGNGGNGGVGQGYLQSATGGVGGQGGTAGAAGGTNAGTGGTGGLGGNGGTGKEYGLDGFPGIQGNTGVKGGDGNVSGTVTGGTAGLDGVLPVGNGGIAGKAITGSNYTINPSPPPSETIKGGYT